MVESGKSFLQLQEDHSRRSSLHPPSISILDGSTSGSAYTTRLACCGGCCSLKVERDDGSTRIGRLSLAPYCHLALIIFGFCFLLVGGILTTLAYSTRIDDRGRNGLSAEETPKIAAIQVKDGNDSERVAGPLFLALGLFFVVTGTLLAVLGCKLERAAVRQRSALSRFSVDCRGGDFFANLEDIPISRRRSSFFGTSFHNNNRHPTDNSRRSTMTCSTITQAVPLGFFITNEPHMHPSLHPTNSSHSPNSQKLSPAHPSVHEGEFQEVELSSPTSKHVSYDDEFNLPELATRPSIRGITMFINDVNGHRQINNEDEYFEHLPSRSDVPFGSIISLGSGSGDIASFPLPRANKQRSKSNSEETDLAFSTAQAINKTQTEMPPIRIDETGNALTVSTPVHTKAGRSRSVGDESCMQQKIVDQEQKRPFSGS